MRVTWSNTKNGKLSSEEESKRSSFELKVCEECAFLLSDKGVFFHYNNPNAREDARRTPHVFLQFPFCAVVDIDKNTSLIDVENIRAVEVNSRRLFESQGGRYHDKGYRVVNFDEETDLGVLVKIANEWDFVDQICEWCGGPFPDGLTARQRGGRRFCSIECGRRFRSFNRQYGEMLAEGKFSITLQIIHDMGVPGIELARMIRGPCLHCGNMIGDNKSLRVKFCSDLCRHAHYNKKRK